MAIAHVCPQCGLDLSRRRPQRDPHYGLRLIICCCGWATTRQKHPVWQFWRSFCRLTPAMLALGGQIAAAVSLAIATTFAATWIGAILMSDQMNPRLVENRVWLIWPLLIVPIITGAWLRATLSHWRFALQWLAWTAIMAVTIAVAFLLAPGLWEPGLATDPNAGLSTTVRVLSPLWAWSMAALLIMMLVSSLGSPLGAAIILMHARRRQRRWRRRRVRLRAKGLSA